ncbi:hypothetical protein [Microbacterium elymi]|uniref:Uncharacterized protein n=1 Tax=Microbacterium elymi TaxID=2909587 RepID=A0ABY5NGL9_9MICO|nr:hypothetical protein [Microbacterium elymi]UUT34307.1 hypothetical protein L2X98_26970 [Microbacterium elymi]
MDVLRDLVDGKHLVADESALLSLLPADHSAVRGLALELRDLRNEGDEPLRKIVLVRRLVLFGLLRLAVVDVLEIEVVVDFFVCHP